MATSTCLLYIVRLQAGFKVSSSVFINKTILLSEQLSGLQIILNRISDIKNNKYLRVYKLTKALFTLR